MLTSVFRFIYTLGVLSLVSVSLGAQTLSGTVFDAGGEGIPYGNVLLISDIDSSFLGGTTTDSAGHYRLEAAALNDCSLKVMALGFASIYQTVDPSVRRYDIVVKPAGTTLSEVTVKGRKLLYEQRTDRLVMNVAATPSLSGNTALQVLQKAPGVVVNRQNNSIGIASRGEVLLMIGERVQRAPAAVVMAQLEAMPAENIERIEIIHQPPAKYDAGGTAGIVRIVLKKQTARGTQGNLSLTAGYGRGPKGIGNLALNHVSGNLTVYGDYTYNLDRHSAYTVDHYREYTYDGRSYYFENLVTYEDRRPESHALNLGFDLTLSPSTVLAASVSAAQFQEWIPRATSRSFGRVDGAPQTDRSYLMQLLARSRNGFANLNLMQKVGDRGNLDVAGDYVSISFDNTGRLTQEGAPDEMAITTERTTPVKIWTGRADYRRDLPGEAKLEIGAKATSTNSSSTAKARNPGDESWSVGQFINRDNRVREQILALYGSVNLLPLPGMNAELGIRLEDYRFDLYSSDGNGRNNVWTNVFPIVRLNYALDSVYSLQLSVNRGITRPPFAYQSGFLALFDPTLFVASNAALQPSFSNQVRLALQRRASVLSLTYVRSKGDRFWQNTVEKDQGLQLSFPDNLDLSQALLLDFSSSIALTPWWEFTGTLSTNWVKVEDEVGRKLRYEDELVSFVVQVSQSLSFANRWRFNIDARYASDYLFGDQVQFNYPFVNLGLRHQFPNGSSLILAVQDPTNTMARRDWSYSQPELEMTTYGSLSWSEPQVRLTYATSFGDTGTGRRKDRAATAKEIRDRL